MDMIETYRLTKRFGYHTALANIDMRVAAGETVALVGPNGAGKTTLLRLIATLMRPSAGHLTIAGLNPTRHGAVIRRRIGFVSHSTLLYEDLTVIQNLRFYAQLYGMADGTDRACELLACIGLAERQHDLVRTLSRGLQQRLSIARALLHRPQLLLLDEPFAGLDHQAMDVLTNLLGKIAGEGCTIVLSTHRMDTAFALSERVLALTRGRIAIDAPTSSLTPETLATALRMSPT